jgi:hypothetical protein
MIYLLFGVVFMLYSEKPAKPCFIYFIEGLIENWGVLNVVWQAQHIASAHQMHTSTFSLLVTSTGNV